jgi:hypothetical protein
MDILDTLLAVTVSMLAVFGLWCAIKVLGDMIFAPRCLMVAIEIKNEKDAEMLDVLLQQAHSAFFRQKMRRVVVLIDQPLLYGCIGHDGVPSVRVLELLAYYGAEYRVIS